MDVLYSLDSRRTFTILDSSPQLTAAAETFNYAYCLTYGVTVSLLRQLADLSVA
jgi:hypothetical protein